MTSSEFIKKDIERQDEIRVLVDLARDKWILFWADPKLNEAARRLHERGLVQIINDDNGGPKGRFELWPVVRERILLVGVINIHLENQEDENK